MALGSAIQEVLSLQPKYSSVNTDEMRRRGELIRHAIPNEIAQIRGDLAKAAGIKFSDLLIEGRDGTGLKAEVPWARFASQEASPSATTGWYVVWLHRGDGSGAYLTLAHGSTQLNAGALIARSDVELAQLMDWSRSVLSNELVKHPQLTTSVQLRTKGKLAAAYEKSCVAAFFYPAQQLADDSKLRQDMLVMAGLLGRLYEAERLGLTPLSQNPEVRDAIEAVAVIARPLASNAHGFALTAMERRAVELRAMAVATHCLEQLGYGVKDVSSRQSFDLQATRSGETVKVEVKGTTGTADSILLTKNEVELHKIEFPNNALIVVHSIRLTKGAIPVATDGTLKLWHPWTIEEGRLRGITFIYQLT